MSIVTVYDAVDVPAIPAWASTVLAYADGGYITLPAVRARFPGARILTVTTDGRTGADLGDCESGDLIPETAAVLWKQGDIRAIYSDTSDEEAIADYVGGPFDWWPADPTGTPHLYVPKTSLARVVGTQWAWPDHGSPGNFDISLALSTFVTPSAPPPPSPAPNPSPTPEEIDMGVSAIVSFKPGQIDGLQVYGGELWHKWQDETAPGKWNNEPVAAAAGVTGVTFPDQVPQWSQLGGENYVTVEDSGGRFWMFAQGPSGPWGVNELP